MSEPAATPSIAVESAPSVTSADTAAEMQVEREQRQKMRSIAIAVALILLVILFYAATIVRLGGNVMNRAL